MLAMALSMRAMAAACWRSWPRAAASTPPPEALALVAVAVDGTRTADARDDAAPFAVDCRAARPCSEETKRSKGPDCVAESRSEDEASSFPYGDHDR